MVQNNKGVNASPQRTKTNRQDHEPNQHNDMFHFRQRTHDMLFACRPPCVRRANTNDQTMASTTHKSMPTKGAPAFPQTVYNQPERHPTYHRRHTPTTEWPNYQFVGPCRPPYTLCVLLVPTCLRSSPNSHVYNKTPQKMSPFSPRFSHCRLAFQSHANRLTTRRLLVERSLADHVHKADAPGFVAAITPRKKGQRRPTYRRICVHRLVGKATRRKDIIQSTVMETMAANSTRRPKASSHR
jgi:hypothetical protein